MRFGKRLVGLGLAALGAVGIVVCLAGIAGVWIAGSRLQQVNSKVFSQADQLIVQVDRRAAQAREAVGGTRDLVDELKQTLRDSATELVAERVASLPEIDNLERRLASAMERADGLVQVSASTAELIEQLLATVGAVASERDVDLKASSELMATIRSTRESLANASRTPGGGPAPSGRDSPETRGGRQSLADHEALTRHRRQAGCRARADRRIPEPSRRNEESTRVNCRTGFRAWVFAGQCLIVLLIGWGGAGQYCLLLQGWRILRLPPPTVRKSPPAAGRG